MSNNNNNTHEMVRNVVVSNNNNTREMVRNLVDNCVQDFLNKHGGKIDSLDMDKQLALGDTVRTWRQRLEDGLCQHLEEHDVVTDVDVRRLVREAAEQGLL